MKSFILILFTLLTCLSYGQNNTFISKPPVFENCKNQEDSSQLNCFNEEVFNFIFKNFQTPKEIDSNYKGEIVVVFEVTEKGVFKTIFIDAF